MRRRRYLEIGSVVMLTAVVALCVLGLLHSRQMQVLNAALAAELERQFLESDVWRADVERTEELLRQGARPDLRGPSGWTPLSVAAAAGDTALALRLLSAGVEPDVPDKEGRTPLHLAVYASREEIVMELLRWGADPNHRDRDQGTPLMQAASWPGIDVSHPSLTPEQVNDLRRSDAMGRRILEALLNHGADPNAGGKEGVTPLQVAASMGHAEHARILIEAGAEVNSVNERGNSALGYTFEPTQAAVRSVLERHGARPTPEDRLSAAMERNDGTAVRSLLKAGARTTAYYYRGSTVLHWAARRNDTALIRELLARGMDIEQPDWGEWTPLVFAVEAGSADAVRLLLARGADTEAVDLDQVARRDVHPRPEIVRLLKEAAGRRSNR